jgi:hypothetical protein
MQSLAILLLLLVFNGFMLAENESKTQLPEATANAIKLSKITAPGDTPFHLKATVREPGNRDSAYKAEIEEYWVAPDKWRRTIKAADFSQTLIVNGDSQLEQTTGDYYPFWLRNIVTALFDLVPDEFVPRNNIEVAKPSNTALPNIGSLAKFSADCSRWNEIVGSASTQNSVFTTICFAGGERLLTGLSTPYFHAEFLSHDRFKRKEVARRIVANPEAGVQIEARISELSELRHVDESLFAVPKSTPENELTRSVRLREDDAHKLLLEGPEIQWVPVHDGRTSGVLSVMVYVDKHGRVRETWPLNSDNPFPQAQARQEIAKWRFKPMERDGVPVQMETLLTLHFQTTVSGSIPLLSDAEARKRAISKADPKFLQTTRPKGTEFTVRILVDEQGQVIDIDNPNHLDTGLFEAAKGALSLWIFRPYKADGKVQRFNADITFHIQ